MYTLKYLTITKMKNYNFYLLLCLALCTQVITAQSQLEVETASSEVAKFKSTTGVTTTIALENDGDLPAGGAVNNRRGYLETRANDVILGPSSNNTGGDIILKLPATSLGRILLANNTTNHIVMRSNGDLGIGTDNPSTKLDVDGQARIRNLPTGGATDQLLTTDADGNIRKVPVSSIGAGNTAIGFASHLESNILLPDGDDVDFATLTETYDPSNNFNPNTGRFTASQDGFYHFTFSTSISTSGGAYLGERFTSYMWIDLAAGGSVYDTQNTVHLSGGAGLVTTFILDRTVYLNQNDEVYFRVKKGASSQEFFISGAAVTGTRSKLTGFLVH